MLSLNAGCGPDLRPGFVNIDTDRGYHPDVACDASYLPFRDNTFDIVFARDLLHHVHDPLKAISELARVSAGKVEIWESSRSNPFMLFMMLASRFEHDHFSESAFQRLFRDYTVRFRHGNDFAHFTSRYRLILPIAAIGRRMSAWIPSYNIAFIEKRTAMTAPDKG